MTPFERNIFVIFTVSVGSVTLLVIFCTVLYIRSVNARAKREDLKLSMEQCYHLNHYCGEVTPPYLGRGRCCKCDWKFQVGSLGPLHCELCDLLYCPSCAGKRLVQPVYPVPSAPVYTMGGYVVNV